MDIVKTMTNFSNTHYKLLGHCNIDIIIIIIYYAINSSN